MSSSEPHILGVTPERIREVQQEEESRKKGNATSMTGAFWASLLIAAVVSAWLIGSYILGGGLEH